MEDVDQPSLADELGAAYDSATEEVTETEDTTDAVVEEPIETVETPEETEEVTEEETTDEESTDEPEKLSAPEHWSKEHKETFASLAPEAQTFLLERHKAMEGDYTRKSMEVAEIRKNYEPIEQIFATYQADLKAQGITPAEVINRWASVDRFLAEHPAEGIQWLAQSYNIDLGQLVEQPVNPELMQLRQEIHALKGSMSQRAQQEQWSKQQTYTQQIESFSTETDEAGNPAHPYFESVVEDMVILAQAEQAAGRTPELKALYERAIWSNPEVRERMLSDQKAEQARKADQEARAKAAKAKKAGKSVSGSPTGSASMSEDMNLRESLERQFG